MCLATDLGMGFPFEHGLHSTLVAMRLADRLGVDRATGSQTYYACLLSHSGCTTDAHVTAEVFGDSLTTHLNPVVYRTGAPYKPYAGRCVDALVTALFRRQPCWRLWWRRPAGHRAQHSGAAHDDERDTEFPACSAARPAPRLRRSA